MLITGLRRSELLGLAWDAVDLEQGTNTIKRVVLDVYRAPLLRETGKSENSLRTTAIPPLLIELLRAQKLTASKQPCCGARVTGGNRCSPLRARMASRTTRWE